MQIDWRLERLLDKEYLQGIALQFRKHRPFRPGWEHDHCEGCLATFAEIGLRAEPTLQEGYTTCADFAHGEEYWWVCSECFDAFKAPMEWQVSNEFGKPNSG